MERVGNQAPLTHSNTGMSSTRPQAELMSLSSPRSQRSVDEVVSASGGFGTSGFGTAFAAAAMVLAFVGLVVGSIAGTHVIEGAV